MIDHDDIAELRDADNCLRRLRRSLSANPDCRDPDHPGCTACEQDDTTNDDQDDD